MSSVDLMTWAVEVETTKAAGRAIGLAPEETDEVIHLWLRAYRERGVLPVDWSRIRSMLPARAIGAAWRP